MQKRHFFELKSKMSIVSKISVQQPSSLKNLMPVREEVHRIYGVADFNGFNIEIPSSMYQHGIELYIELDSTDFQIPKMTVIRLIGIIKLSISEYPMPHGNVDPNDPNLPAVLSITYLYDVFNHSSVNVINFIAIRRLLENFKDEVESIIRVLKSGLNMSPSLDNLNKKLRMRAQSFDLEYLANQQQLLRQNKFKITCESTILTSAEIEHIRLFMPKRYRLLSWEILYSADNDGVSFSTFYSKAMKKMPAILIVLGRDGSRVGAFLSSGIEEKHGFYGTGETFVFHFDPYFAGFRWSQNNDLFISTTRKDLMIGGGSRDSVNNGSAIYIDDNFMNCYSQDCETFNSPKLGKSESFPIVAVELWHAHP